MVSIYIEKEKFVFNTEEEQKLIFSKILRNHGWVVHTEKKTIENNRVDIIACHHSSPKDYIIFELKYLTNIQHYLTKPFKQIMDKYYNKKICLLDNISTKIVCLITPFPLRKMCSNEMVNLCIERYYWRMGFGIGNLEEMKVSFTSSCNDCFVNLLHPNSLHKSLEKQLKLIKERQHWDVI